MSAHPIPTAALDDRLAFVGTSGSGKTYSAGTAVERLLAAKARTVIVDPLGVWWGLRLLPDGKTPSPWGVVIFGGEHGDLPLNEHAGKIIGETVAGMAESCIVSLDGLGTKTAERRFMLAFLETLYRKATGEPFHIIFDEADLWAPQKASEPTLQNLMEQIVRRGRVKGFIPWLITQRPAVLSKDVLSQADGLVAMKLTASQDRDALGAWIEGQADRAEEKRILARLPQLARGESIVWIPGRGVLAEAAFPIKATFDSSRTPKRGEKRQARELTPIDLGALKDRLATVEQEAKANDPRALKAEIARLQRQMRDAAALAAKAGQVPDPAAIEAAREDGFAAGVEEGLRLASVNFVLGIDDEIAAAKAKVDALAAWRKRITTGGWLSEIGERPKRVASPVPRPAQKPIARPTAIRPAAVAANGTLGAERKPLMTLASAYPGGLTEAQWATIAGFKRTGGTWSTYKSRLRGAGMIEQRGALWHATEAALAVLGDVPPAPTTPEERVAMWKAALGSGPSKILDHLVDAYPDAVSRDELAAAVEMAASGGTFSTYLSRLSGNGLIERSAGALRASEALFS